MKKDSESFEVLHKKITLNSVYVICSFLLFLIIAFNIYFHNSRKNDVEAFIRSVLNNDGYSLFNSRDYIDMLKNDMIYERKLPTEPVKLPYSYKRKIMKNSLDAFHIEKIVPNGYRNFCSVRIALDKTKYSYITNFKSISYLLSQDYLVSRIVPHMTPENDFHQNQRVYCSDIFNYAFVKENDCYILVIVDKSNEIIQQRDLAVVSILIFIVSLFFVFIISWFTSYTPIHPIKVSFENQKQFIADASHELKTPIAVIGANVDVLKNEYPDNKWIEYICTENKRMGELVKDMLYLAKNDAGRILYEMLPFDLSDVCACAVLPFESVAFEGHKEFVIDIPKEPLPVVGDAEKIKQLIIILVDNAFKNSENNGIVKISLKKDETHAYITVYNSCSGISKEDMKKIFDRFYRSDASRARVSGGSGLGLSIAKTISVAHKGRIEVESDEKTYAQFKFSMPLSYKIKTTADFD